MEVHSVLLLAIFVFFAFYVSVTKIIVADLLLNNHAKAEWIPSQQVPCVSDMSHL